jgi:hypothetical protein
LPYDIELIDGLPYTGNNRLPYEIESIDGPETYVPTVMGLKQRFNRTWRNMVVIKTSCSTKSKRKRAIGSQCYCLPHWRRVVVMPLSSRHVVIVSLGRRVDVIVLRCLFFWDMLSPLSSRRINVDVIVMMPLLRTCYRLPHWRLVDVIVLMPLLLRHVSEPSSANEHYRNTLQPAIFVGSLMSLRT